MTYLLFFATSMSVAYIATFFVKHAAVTLHIIDHPIGARKIHTKPIPLLGGIGVYVTVAFIVMIALLIPSTRLLLIDAHVTFPQIAGLLTGGFVLAVGGFFDDKYNLKPQYQIIAPISASLIVIMSGMTIHTLTNPLGGIIDIASESLSASLTFIWLLTTIYTTKFLDGLDGLAAGITSIGSVIIALLSIFFFVNIPTAHLATIIAGAYAGFLIWNFHPAKIFLGEAGSTLAGYFLGVLAIISGAKLATALLILGIPILDATHVIFRRIIIEKKSPFKGDRKHIHFRLYDMGCTQRQAVLMLYCIAAFFGLAALFLQSSQKLTALIAVFLMMFLLGFAFNKKPTSQY